MIRDRGNKKWTAMMLPEHLERLREWKEEDKLYRRKQPDEQQLDEWNYRFIEAIEQNKQITITYWKSNGPITHTGFIQITASVLKLTTLEAVEYIIPVNDIENVSEIE